MPRKRNSKKKQKLCMVEYDLRQSDPNKRKFYQKLRKLDVKRSTQSVILTSDLEKAKLIHKMASKGLKFVHKRELLKMNAMSL